MALHVSSSRQVRRRDIILGVFERPTQSFGVCQYQSMNETSLIANTFASSRPQSSRTRASRPCHAATAPRGDETAALDRAVSTERPVIRGTSTFAFWHFALVRWDFDYRPLVHGSNSSATETLFLIGRRLRNFSSRIHTYILRVLSITRRDPVIHKSIAAGHYLIFKSSHMFLNIYSMFHRTF